GQLVRRTVGLADVARAVEVGEAGERSDLAPPGRVSARVGDVAGARLHRAVERAAEADGLGAGVRDLLRQQVARRAAPGEVLVATAHRARVPVEHVLLALT